MSAKLIELLGDRLADPMLLDIRHRARRKYSPQLAYGRHFGPKMTSTRPAAVLAVIEPTDDGWCIPLTVRPQHLPDHPGQISLPGGRLEAGEDAWQASQREFHEELGVPFSGTRVGQLLPIYVFNSDYHVIPFVAVAEKKMSYQPCQREVDRVVRLPLEALIDVGQHPEYGFRRGTLTWRSRIIPHVEDRIWGATAIMLGELAALLAEPDTAQGPADSGMA